MWNYLIGLPHSIASPFYLSSGLRITASGPGWVQLRIPGVDHLVHLLLTPYANEFRMKTFLGSENQDETLREILSNNWHANLQEMANYQSVNILMAHLYMISSEDEPLEEPLDEEKPILTPGGALLFSSSNCHLICIMLHWGTCIAAILSKDVLSQWFIVAALCRIASAKHFKINRSKLSKPNPIKPQNIIPLV
jgi:hypothetical protein